MDPFIGEIRMTAFNFPPRGWAACNGQIIGIAQNTALFSLLGVNFGGDGRTTFGLPNFQANAPMGAGNGPGLTPRSVGQTGGSAAVTLQISEMAMHNHGMMAASGFGGATSNTPANNVFATSTGGNAYTPAANPAVMAPAAVTNTGGGGAHNNMMPYLTVSFSIALQGIFPQRP